MAEQIAHDAEPLAQPMGASSPVDDTVNTSNASFAGSGQNPTTSNEHADGIEQKHVADTEMETSEEAATVESGDQRQSEIATNAAFADASGGSDTDTSRTDAADLAQGSELGHVRSNSVKKPTTFKSVSVTKNFLAKAAVAAPNVRSGEKSPATGTTPPQVTAKPRLVAKSALGGAGGRSGLLKPNGASGPDASKVWNKNRPVPPPPPRQFTDEELQTRYGIHLATRLQSDEAGKDPKWADIDDDEDDWAPEEVEWMDGTKSSVPVAEALPTSTPEDKKDTSADDAPGEAVKPVLAPMHKPSASSSVKTILKPGAPSGQPKTGGLVLKGAPEKPTLVAKTPAGPSKSPWAPLPPVDKVPPVVINPPIQQQLPSRFQRDPHGFGSLPPAPSPTKEIAADDFNRSWRDDRGTKELFNSQSGRYEPVTEARRGSRQEHGQHGHRQPAVLQRPSQQGGPAEPSAAFQTSRSGAAETSSWAARRRASSNLSASSAGRRPSFGRLQDLPPRHEFREGASPTSTVAVESPRLAFASIERPQSGQAPWARSSPKLNELHPVTSTHSGSSVPVNGEVASAVAPVEDSNVKQQRLMREKIERAKMQKQREREAEEQEKAARAERLKQKMAALEASSPSPKLEDTKPKDAQITTKSPQQQKITPAASPPKPPVPTSAGEVAQYGMMKVHQPHPVKKNTTTETSLAGKSSLEPFSDANRGSRRAGSPVGPVGRATQSQQPQGPTVNLPKRLPDAPADTVSGPWKSPSPSESLNWGQKTMNAHSAPSGNVWGPPTREKALGNGTFQSHNNLFSSHSPHSNFNNRPAETIAHGLPGVIAPPPQHKISAPAATFDSNSLSHSSSHHDRQVNSPHLEPSSLDQSHSQLNHLPEDSMAPPMDTQTATTDTPVKAYSATNKSQPTPVRKPVQQARPSTNSRFGSAPPPLDSQRKPPNLNPAWGSFAANVKQNEAAISAAAREEMNARRALQTKEPELTWKADKVIYKARESKDVVTSEVIPEKQGLATNAAEWVAQAQAASFGRGSRFFSNGASIKSSSIKSDSPPPPEISDHPAHDGDSVHPKVRLPAAKPTVKLPPQASTSETVPEPLAVRSPARTGDVNTYQQWFDGLLKSDKVTSATKAPLAQPVQRASTVVSLPPHLRLRANVADNGKFTAVSKSQADEMLFEPPEFASKPVVRLPTQPHANHYFGYAHETSLPASRPVITQTVEHADLLPKLGVFGNGFRVVIHLDNKKESKTVDYYVGRGLKKTQDARRTVTPSSTQTSRPKKTQWAKPPKRSTADYRANSASFDPKVRGLATSPSRN